MPAQPAATNAAVTIIQRSKRYIATSKRTFPADVNGTLPLAPINLTVNGGGHCPSYGTGESVVVDWNMTSPLRNLHPVQEDCPSHFADATKLQILEVATETVQWEGTSPTTGNATISNATSLAALGTETDFIIRAWNQRAGLNSINHTQITVRRT